MQTFDVIIIGAGPGGLKCAETLGNSGLSVLIIEKNKYIGPKVCAGGLTGKDIKYLNLPDTLIEFHYDKVQLHVNTIRSTFHYKNDFVYTIDREALGQWQLQKLQSYTNIQIRTETLVTKIDQDHINIGDEKIGYRYLVGADGSTSGVKTYVGIQSKKIRFAMQYLIPSTIYQNLELFFDSKLFATGYARIFPHKKYVSIGCGSDPALISPKQLKEYFHTRLHKKNIDIKQGKYEAFLINCDYQGYMFQNIFLIGDAAGLTSGLTGEGIYSALISGEEVAKKILDPTYISDKISQLLDIKAKHNKLIRLLTKAGKSRTYLFLLGLFLFKFSYFKKKAIAILG